jgi:prenyltransferase beta subunit
MVAMSAANNPVGHVERDKSRFAAEVWRETAVTHAYRARPFPGPAIWRGMHGPAATPGPNPLHCTVFHLHRLRRLVVAALLAALALTTIAAQAHANPTSPPAVTNAAASYLLSAENADGGFGPAPGQPSSALFTGWAALGLAAAGHDLNLVSHGGAGLMTYVRAGPGSAGDVGGLERTILVLDAAGQSARRVGGRDLVAQLEGHIRRNGSVSGQVNLTAFAVLALRGAGVGGGSGAVTRAQRWLAAQQDGDGGFSFATAGSGSDVDDTGAALEALGGDRAAGGVRARAVAFLRRQQDRDGGFPSQPGTGSNAQSTAWAIQGLEASGASPGALHRAGGPSPLDYLDSLAAPSGLIRYSRGVVQTPVWVTGEALMAMEGKPLPVAPAPARSAPPAPARPAGTGSHEAPLGRLAATVGVLLALVLAPIGPG